MINRGREKIEDGTRVSVLEFSKSLGFYEVKVRGCIAAG